MTCIAWQRHTQACIARIHARLAEAKSMVDTWLAFLQTVCKGLSCCSPNMQTIAACELTQLAQDAENSLPLV